MCNHNQEFIETHTHSNQNKSFKFCVCLIFKCSLCYEVFELVFQDNHKTAINHYFALGALLQFNAVNGWDIFETISYV